MGKTADRIIATLLVAFLGGCVAPGPEPGAPRVVERPGPIPVAHIGADEANRLPLSPVDELMEPASGVNPVDERCEHVLQVRAGELWEDLERWTGLTRSEIRASSGIRRARGLRSGEDLVVRLNPEEIERFARMRREHHRQVSERFFLKHRVAHIGAYVVQPGDTPRAVATRGGNDAPTWLLERVNPTCDLGRLRPGDILNVPFVEAAPPVTPREAGRRAAEMEGYLGAPRAEAWATSATPTPGPWVAPAPAPAPLPPAALAAPAKQGGTWFSEVERGSSSFTSPIALHFETIRVRPREYLGLFARWAGVSVDSILRANGMSDARHLRLGQSLRVPVPEVRVADFFAARRGYHAGVSGR